MAAPLPLPPQMLVNSAAPSSLKYPHKTFNGYNGFGGNNSRFRNKRTVRAQRDYGSQSRGVNSCKTRCPSSDRVEPGKDSTCPSSVEVPSGSVDSTTVPPRRKVGGPGAYLKTVHSNSVPHSVAKPPRTGTKQGRTAKPSSFSSLTNGSVPSPPPNLKFSNFKQNVMICSEPVNMDRRRVSSTTVDSGHGDELSSSNNESDSQSKPKPLTAYVSSSPAHHQGGSGSGGGAKQTSSSNNSDVEDDVFLDALSNLASEEECNCSASTSAFVTPLSTRSQSPLHNADPSHHHHCHASMEDQFVQTLTDSLQKVEASRSDKTPATPVEEVEAIADTSTNDCRNAPVSTEEDKTGKSNKKKNRKKRPNGLQSPITQRAGDGSIAITYFSESQYSIPDGEDAGFISPKNRRRKKNVSINESTDSGLLIGDSSVKAKQTPSNLKVPPPPHGQTLVLPQTQTQLSPAAQKRANKKNRKKLASQRISLENSSISSASPTSTCSQSPMTLSPSPTSSFSNHLPVAIESEAPVSLSLQSSIVSIHSVSSSCASNAQGQSEEAGKDEWPDLGELVTAMSTTVPHVRSPPETAIVHTHLEVEAKVLEESLHTHLEAESLHTHLEAESLHTHLEAESLEESLHTHREEEEPLHIHLEVEAKVLEESLHLEEEEEEEEEPLHTRTHLEVETKVLEQSSLEYSQEGVSHSPSVESSSEHPRLQSPLTVVPSAAVSSSVSYSPMVVTSSMHGYGQDMLSPVFNDPLSQPRPNISPEQYLWMHHQQLRAFIHKHQQQHENQTDDHIFYPVDPLPVTPPLPLPVTPSYSLPETCAIAGNPSCPLPLPPRAPPGPLPPMHQLSDVVQLPLFPPLLPPHPLSPTRPLFFPPRSPHGPQDPLGQLVSGPPQPPPPPPLPVHPYQMTPPHSSNTGVMSETTLLACQDIEERELAEVEDEEDPFSSEDCVDESSQYFLEDSWVMWYDKSTGQRNQCAAYEASLKRLLEVKTIEVFWQLYNNIWEPCEMDQNSNLHFFKSGIQPMWEDAANKDGGKWVLTIKTDLKGLSKTWLEVLLFLIGGWCTERSKLINGAVVSRRKKGDRISLWTATRKEKANLDICAFFVKSLLLAYDVPPEGTKSFVKQLAEGKSGLSLVFMHHQDSLKSGHSYHNDAHIVLINHLEVLLQKIEKIPLCYYNS